ncbi:MAG: GNAT family N-acetyltransferase [Nitratireductor sp.]|nr:GNAT family N-acetyltransferase [Nitratireductor sp.]
MTAGTAIVLRPGEPRDAADLAIIDNMSSHGMSLAFWQQAVADGEAEDPLLLGRERFGDAASVFGWSNAIVAENADTVAGSVTGYEMPAPDASADRIKFLFPGFAPVFELFARCVGDWFIDSMGVFPAYRGAGIAARLIDQCLEQGRKKALRRASLIVESDNQAATRLYASRNFSTRDSLPFRDRLGNAVVDKNWLLMSAEL